jgi:hypothetical protein
MTQARENLDGAAGDLLLLDTFRFEREGHTVVKIIKPSRHYFFHVIRISGNIINVFLTGFVFYSLFHALLSWILEGCVS